jgi:hypothetical protein
MEMRGTQEMQTAKTGRIDGLTSLLLVEGDEAIVDD